MTDVEAFRIGENIAVTPGKVGYQNDLMQLLQYYPATDQGKRPPLLIIPPFARGGLVSHNVFDHTSLLRFLETRFGAEVPNLTSWRRSITGDLTSAFNFAKVNTSVPSLPQPSRTDSRVTMSTCATSAPLDLATDSTNSLKTLEQTVVASYPVTVNSAAPPQESGTMPTPSGPVPCTH